MTDIKDLKIGVRRALTQVKNVEKHVSALQELASQVHHDTRSSESFAMKRESESVMDNLESLELTLNNLLLHLDDDELTNIVNNASKMAVRSGGHAEPAQEDGEVLVLKHAYVHAANNDYSFTWVGMPRSWYGHHVTIYVKLED